MSPNLIPLPETYLTATNVAKIVADRIKNLDPNIADIFTKKLQSILTLHTPKRNWGKERNYDIGVRKTCFFRDQLLDLYTEIQ